MTRAKSGSLSAVRTTARVTSAPLKATTRLVVHWVLLCSSVVSAQTLTIRQRIRDGSGTDAFPQIAPLGNGRYAIVWVGLSEAGPGAGPCLSF